MPSTESYFEDEIDLREVVKTLLNRKWLILGFSFLVALSGFLVTYFVLTKQYQATAYVVITKPALTTSLDPRIQTSPQLPDTKSLIELTKADDLVLAVIQSLEVVEMWDEEISIFDVKDNLEVALVGSNQLRLTATDADPQRAATIANVWAEEVAVRLNHLLGIEEDALSQVESQAEEAFERWDSAEQALLDLLPQNRVDALQVKLVQARDQLRFKLDRINSLEALISDAQVLKKLLRDLNPQDELRLAHRLNLLTIQQRAAGALEGIQFQIATPISEGESYQVVEASADLDHLIAALQEQRQEYLTGLEEQEALIDDLVVQFENAQYQVDTLKTKRDLAKNAYQALSNHTEEVRISLFQNDKPVKIAGMALPPEKHSSPRTVLNTVLAGAIGFMFSVFFVLVVGWWRSSPSLPQKS